MYEVTPKKSNKAAQYTSVTLLISAFAAMVFSGIPGIPFRAVMQFLALVILSLSILLMTRYTLCAYSYAIVSDHSGGYDLTVTELKRKSRITVCRIGLSGIEQVTLAKSADKALSANLKELSKGRKAYNYCIDLAPAQYIHIISEECGEALVIKLSYDERLFSILSDHSSPSSSESTLP